jgi:cytochrome P450
VSWHKNPYTADSAAFATIDHELHRLRRATLNPYFSKSQIRKFAPWIQDRADTLCRRFQQEYKDTDKVLVINEAYGCLTADAVFEYSFAENYNLVETPNFHAPLIKTLEIYLRSIHIATNIPGLPQLIFNILPQSFVTWLDPSSDINFKFRDVRYRMRV